MTECEIYLLTGPEAGDRNEAIDTLRKEAIKRNGSIDEYKYYAGETRVADVIFQLQNVSLFSKSLFIIVKNAELIKTKSDIELISSWAKSSAGSPNTLILISDQNSVEKKLESCVPSSHKKIFWEMFDNKKEQWVSSFFKKNGFSVTEDAVQSILDMVENDKETLKNECSRFFYCFPKGHVVTDEDVEKILAHNREESAFSLFEAMADNSKSPSQRLEVSLEILQKIRMSSASSSYAIIAGLLYCFRQLRTYHGLCTGGSTPAESALKSAGFYNKTMQERYRKASKVWGPGNCASVIALLSSTDMEIREGGTFQEDTKLTMLVYSIVMKNGLYCSTYQK